MDISNNIAILKELVAKSKVVEIHPNAIKIGEGENKVRKIPETFEEEKKRKDHIIVFRTFVEARIFNKIYAVKFLLRYAYKIKKRQQNGTLYNGVDAKDKI